MFIYCSECGWNIDAVIVVFLVLWLLERIDCDCFEHILKEGRCVVELLLLFLLVWLLRLEL